eukprot:356782-Chlamydomonas_euryale.AAC.3
MGEGGAGSRRRPCPLPPPSLTVQDPFPIHPIPGDLRSVEHPPPFPLEMSASGTAKKVQRSGAGAKHTASTTRVHTCCQI